MEQKKMTKQELFLWGAFAFAPISAVSQTVWVLRLGLPMSVMGRLFMTYVLPYLLPAAAHFIAGGKYRRWAYAAGAVLLGWQNIGNAIATLRWCFPHIFNFNGLNVLAMAAAVALYAAAILYALGFLKNEKTRQRFIIGCVALYAVARLVLAIWFPAFFSDLLWGLVYIAPWTLWMLGEKEEFLTPVIKQSAPAPKAVQPAMNMEVNTMDVNATNGVAMKFCSHCGKEIMAAAVVCPHCGCAVGNVPVGQSNEAASGGEKVIAFLLPIVGLILYLVNNDKAPVKAKEIGKWALIGFLVGIGCSVLLGIIGGAATASLYY